MDLRSPADRCERLAYAAGGAAASALGSPGASPRAARARDLEQKSGSGRAVHRGRSHPDDSQSETPGPNDKVRFRKTSYRAREHRNDRSSGIRSILSARTRVRARGSRRRRPACSRGPANVSDATLSARGERALPGRPLRSIPRRNVRWECGVRSRDGDRRAGCEQCRAAARRVSKTRGLLAGRRRGHVAVLRSTGRLLRIDTWSTRLDPTYRARGAVLSSNHDKEDGRSSHRIQHGGGMKRAARTLGTTTSASRAGYRTRASDRLAQLYASFSRVADRCEPTRYSARSRRLAPTYTGSHAVVTRAPRSREHSAELSVLRSTTGASGGGRAGSTSRAILAAPPRARSRGPSRSCSRR